MRPKQLLPILAFSLAACTTETYDSGDGKYSMMRADFVETRTNSAGELYCAVTDEGDSLVLSPKRTAKWAATPDSLYRALLYYNVPQTGIEVKTISLTSIPTPLVRMKEDVKEQQTDPDEKQTIGLMCDEITTDSEGHRHYSLTLLHAQNGVPEYYSAELFLSIADYRLPEKPAKGDIITITINTYKGKTERSFQY